MTYATIAVVVNAVLQLLLLLLQMLLQLIMLLLLDLQMMLSNGTHGGATFDCDTSTSRR